MFFCHPLICLEIKGLQLSLFACVILRLPQIFIIEYFLYSLLCPILHPFNCFLEPLRIQNSLVALLLKPNFLLDLRLKRTFAQLLLHMLSIYQSFKLHKVVRFAPRMRVQSFKCCGLGRHCIIISIG